MLSITIISLPGAFANLGLSNASLPRLRAPASDLLQRQNARTPRFTISFCLTKPPASYGHAGQTALLASEPAKCLDFGDALDLKNA